MLRASLPYSLLALMLGCAGWQQQLTPSQSKAEPTRQARASDAIKEFEQRRDAAQYQAALDRCRQGDLLRAESLLSSLVGRQPEFYEARLRLAELLSARGDPAAEAHFQAVLAAQPARAEAHHAFGLFLNSQGRSAAARDHLAQATSLDPQNEIFKITLADFP